MSFYAPLAEALRGLRELRELRLTTEVINAELVGPQDRVLAERLIAAIGDLPHLEVLEVECVPLDYALLNDTPEDTEGRRAFWRTQFPILCRSRALRSVALTSALLDDANGDTVDAATAAVFATHLSTLPALASARIEGVEAEDERAQAIIDLFGSGVPVHRGDEDWDVDDGEEEEEEEEEG
jgi:hypothetical protein